MNTTISFVRNLSLLISLAIFAASCGGSNSKQNEERYNQQVKATQAAAKKYNDLVQTHFQNSLTAIEIDQALITLDKQAKEFRAQVRKIEDYLPNGDAATTQTMLNDLKIKRDAALQSVHSLEDLVSKNWQSELQTYRDMQGVDPSIKSLLDEAMHAYLGQLNGIRDLFLGMYNEVIDRANAKFPGHIQVSAPAQSRQAPVALAPENPIATNPSEGGVIRGTARDALTGQVVSGAFVGFKRVAETTDYFYNTTTNAEGVYQSPPLLPGSYFVDIKKDGYNIASGENVEVRRGQTTSENVSMTPPVAGDNYRITLTWTDQKEGAVRDVDSYLSIPGVAASQPLGFHMAGQGEYEGTMLDRDDTQWKGPETVTITHQRAGRYVYYVNNFNDRNDPFALGRSDVNVRVYKGTQMLREYHIPPGQGITYAVFSIDGSGIHDIERYDDSLAHY